MKNIVKLVPALAGVVLFVSGAIAQDTSRVLLEFKPGSKNQIKAAVQRDRGSVHHEFDDLNAIAATLPAQAVEGLKRNPNIVLVEEDPKRVLFSNAERVPFGVDMVGVRQIWDTDNNGFVDEGAPLGHGIKVGVIDSGVFTNHSDFSGVVLTGEASGWNHDHNGHGTHVVGTITASLNGSGVIGVSPGKIAVHMVKVFGDNGEWIYASTLIDAANKAKAAGCKIISMSLGGSGGSVIEDRGFLKLYNSGILLVAAAGNAWDTSTSYPAGYGSVISVAAIDQFKAHAPFSQRNADVELAAPGVAVESTFPLLESNVVQVGTTNYAVNHVENAGRGSVTREFVNGGLGTATDVNASWAGKIVVVQRGQISFAEKVQNAKSAGAAACVIYNNEAGPLYATVGTTPIDLPAVGMTQADGKALLDHAGSTITVTTEVTRNVSAYAAMDGTSMATPHVAAVAAVIWSKHPAKSNAQVRSALNARAEDLGAPGRDPLFGNGLIRAKPSMDYLGTLKR